MTAFNDIQSVAGAVIYIATTSGVATEDLAGFQAKTYVAIGEVTNIGEFGKTFALITHKPIGNRKERKLKGSYNNGKLALEYARVGTNTGQLQLLAALASDASYAFKIVLQQSDEFYFTGKTMSAPVMVGQVDSIVSGKADIEIDSEIILN